MGGGLAFLTKKSFNPANWSNQRQVWEARQKNETEKRATTERHAQLSRERDEEELARAVGGEIDGGRKALGFMYDAGKVPGLERRDNGSNEVGYGESTFGAEDDEDKHRGGGGLGEASIFERQAGDDDAAAAFRAMLARPPPESSSTEQVAGSAAAAARPSENVGGGDNDADGAHKNAKDDKNDRDRDQRTNLEKAVGRGINSGSGITLTQQLERFPMLKSAPMVLQKPGSGDTELPITGLNFKPLGQVLRNVQCLSCREWGHARGDRECKLSGWDPFASAPHLSTTIDDARATAASAPAASSANNEPDSAMHDQRSNLPPTLDVSRKHDNHKKKKHTRRRKDDCHKKSKHKHKRQRKRERSPSYSSSNLASSFSSRDDGGRYGESRSKSKRRYRHN